MQEPQPFQNFNLPRMHHYLFAHQVMPEQFFSNPTSLIGTLSGEEGAEFLRSYWSVARIRLPNEDWVRPDGLTFEIRQPENDITFVLITLPPPQAATEAYFVALAYRQQEAEQPAISRYFLLENGISLEPTPRTVLCEYRGVAVHANLGDGPAPLLEAFCECVLQQL